jgi:type II secretory pathway pseudopilin PulG
MTIGSIKNKRGNLKKCRAFTLTEVAIVLVVTALVLGSLWVALDNASNNVRREKAVEAIASTVTNFRNYYSGQASVPASNLSPFLSKLISENIIPSSLVRSGNTNRADSPWGSYANGVLDPMGTFQVCEWIPGNGMNDCSATALNAPSTFFAVSLYGLTIKDCIGVAEAVTGPKGPSGLVDVLINGNDLVGNAKSFQPVLDTDANLYCANAGNANYVNFVYRLAVPTL